MRMVIPAVLTKKDIPVERAAAVAVVEAVEHRAPSPDATWVKPCRTHYRGTFNDGTQFDSSYDRGEPLEFICGAGQMIKGFDAAVADMEVGQIVDVHLMPEEAYGMADPNAIFTMEIAQLPGSEDLTVGQQVYLSNQYGQPFPVKVTAKDEKNITFDANHEMAGKELNFRIELVEVNKQNKNRLQLLRQPFKIGFPNLIIEKLVQFIQKHVICFYLF